MDRPQVDAAQCGGKGIDFWRHYRSLIKGPHDTRYDQTEVMGCHGAVPYLTLHASESVAVARTPNLLNSARLHKVFKNFVVHGK